jgi:hypothetical protein
MVAILPSGYSVIVAKREGELAVADLGSIGCPFASGAAAGKALVFAAEGEIANAFESAACDSLLGPFSDPSPEHPLGTIRF